ncbi:AEC family transporter [Rhizobium sp. TH2]|uniref:AEC family transporter n=1 Tax=Rhizobium sp. TH2 TaxID=2775403 RepID=UPI0021578F52|nr:AEC family transporter [Rhizobium sp. TH2]UVC11379.1 AEC family transporter [Rhizobium sp. TH2]
MQIISESILPIFLIVVSGIVLKRLPLFDKGLWNGLEQLGFYVLFPCYLFVTLATADYSDIDILPVSVVYLGAVLLMASLLMAAWPLFRARGVGAPQFTSVFQTATRWNGFVALAIAERIADRPGVAMVAFLMGAIIIPINFINIGLLIWFGGGKKDFLTVLFKLVTNPLVFSSLLGVLAAALGIHIYAPVLNALDLLARCALGLGLLIVGAGLQVSDALKPRPVTLIPVFLKLLAFPALVVVLGLIAGLDHTTIQLLGLAASVPTAMNGYLLAKQMGGDAPLYAAISTIQTAAAFITMPLVLALIALF